MNEEKLHGLQGKILKIIVDSKEITSNSEIRKEFGSYYKVFFKNHNSNHFAIMKSFLTKLIFQSLILVTKISVLSDKDLSEPELYMALLGMENNKSPGNDGLTKEFYVFFWNEIKELFINFSHTGLEKQGTKHFTKAGNYKVD